MLVFITDLDFYEDLEIMEGGQDVAASITDSSGDFDWSEERQCFLADLETFGWWYEWGKEYEAVLEALGSLNSESRQRVLEEMVGVELNEYPLVMLELIIKAKQVQMEEVAPTRRMYTTDGGHFVIEVTEISHDKSKNSLMTLWVKNGRLEKHLDKTLAVGTYFYDGLGGCWGMYNPQHTKEGLINFEWILEATPENEQKLVSEAIRRYHEG